MASSRIVSVNFWKDSYIIELTPEEKLLFIYFLTNPKTTLAGIYEISVREVAFDTALDAGFITNTLHKFTVDGKMHFERNWLVLTNFIKHQRLNPSIIRGIEKAIEELPDWLKEKINLSHVEDKQMSIFVTDSPQSGTFPQQNSDNRGDTQSDYTLGTVTPQYNIIKSNLTKLNKKKSNDEAAKPQESSKELSKSQKRSYAIAMDNEREQTKRASESFSRKPSKPGTIMTQAEVDAMYEKRTIRK